MVQECVEGMIVYEEKRRRESLAGAGAGRQLYRFLILED